MVQSSRLRAKGFGFRAHDSRFQDLRFQDLGFQVHNLPQGLAGADLQLLFA